MEVLKFEKLYISKQDKINAHLKNNEMTKTEEIEINHCYVTQFCVNAFYTLCNMYVFN